MSLRPFPGPPPVDPARFVAKGGDEKRNAFPGIDAPAHGLTLDAALEIIRAGCERTVRDTLAGKPGGGSANHVGARITLALYSIAAHGASAAERAAVRDLLWLFYDAPFHGVFQARDETMPPGYANYWIGSACGALHVLDALGWHAEAELVRQWLRAELALLSLCSLDGHVYRAGKRTARPGVNPSVDAALLTLTTGAEARESLYQALNQSRTVANRAATYARGIVRLGIWRPAPADMADLPRIAAAPGAYHVARGTDWLRVWCERWTNPYPGDDHTHHGVQVVGGKATWWSETNADVTPRTPAPWPDAFPGAVTEHWAGGSEGWRRVGEAGSPATPVAPPPPPDPLPPSPPPVPAGDCGVRLDRILDAVLLLRRGALAGGSKELEKIVRREREGI